MVVDEEAWSLDLIREAGRYERDDLVITWEAGQNSALDSSTIADGRDIGNVVVQRDGGAGPEDVPYDISFAFAFHAFHPRRADPHRRGVTPLLTPALSSRRGGEEQEKVEALPGRLSLTAPASFSALQKTPSARP